MAKSSAEQEIESLNNKLRRHEEALEEEGDYSTPTRAQSQVYEAEYLEEKFLQDSDVEEVPIETPCMSLYKEELIHVDKDSEDDMDEEIKKILGDDEPSMSAQAPPVHKDVAKRWKYILRGGAKPKEDLLKKYPAPQNLQAVNPPKLNNEVAAAVSETGKNRDKKLIREQQQLGCAIAALSAI